jgi:hypothetical protein
MDEIKTILNIKSDINQILIRTDEIIFPLSKFISLLYVPETPWRKYNSFYLTLGNKETTSITQSTYEKILSAINELSQ